MSYWQEPQWLDARQRRFGVIPEGSYAWLKDQGSLTKQVIAQCGRSGFRVQVVDQGLAYPWLSEAEALAIPAASLCWIRQVRLCCGSANWVYARSVIPLSSLKGGARRLSVLGEKPLGQVLFSDPRTQRLRMQIAKLKPGQKLFKAASCGAASTIGSMWARRTVFEYDGKPLLVNEVFLPELGRGQQ